MIKKMFLVFGFLILCVAIYGAWNIYREREVIYVNQDKLNTEETVMLKKDYISVKSGDFGEIDLIHRGSGSAEVFVSGENAFLDFKDFNVTNGPDLFVYLSKNKNITDSRDLGEYVSLGRLKSSKGDQSYVLPSDYMSYSSVAIWCRAFGVLFTVAELK